MSLYMYLRAHASVCVCGRVFVKQDGSRRRRTHELCGTDRGLTTYSNAHMKRCASARCNARSFFVAYSAPHLSKFPLTPIWHVNLSPNKMAGTNLDHATSARVYITGGVFKCACSGWGEIMGQCNKTKHLRWVGGFNLASVTN